MARWCARRGARVRVWDSREAPPQAAGAARAACRRRSAAARRAGRRRSFDGVQLRAEEPGPGAARRAHRARCCSGARRRGMLVQGELELFAQALADLKAERGYAPQGARHHRHQRQDHHHRDDRAAGRARRPARRRWPATSARRMLQTLADALDARRRLPRTTAAAARGLGARTVELPARRASRASSPTRPRCSTSRRTTSTGTARWPPTRPPRRASSASTR